MAVGGVWYELVSGSNFPETWEITGKILSIYMKIIE